MRNRLVMTMAVAGIAGCFPALAQTAPPAPPRTHTTIIMHGGTYLGVGVMDIDSARAQTLKLKEPRGAEVTRVDQGTPADKAGIKSGDVILEYNGQQVEGTEELQRLVRETPPGRQVKIGVWRNGAPLTVTATVEENKGMSSSTGNWPPLASGDWPPQIPGNWPPMPQMPSIDIPRMITAFQTTALGVECEALPANSQLADFFGVKDGLLVRSVSHNSAAEKAGIKAGDVIVKAGDTHVATMRDLTAAVHIARPKGSLPLTVVRNRHEMPLTAALPDNGLEHY
jgi:serine protease Do